MKLCVGLDIDGPLYDWHSAIFTYCQYELGYKGTYEQFWTEYFNNLKPEKQLYLISLPIPYEMILPPETVLKFLEDLASKTEFYYITSRDKSLERVTRKYFRTYKFPYQDNLFMTDDKLTVARYLGITHYVDDKTEQIEKLSQVADSYLYAKLWNREDRERFPTVFSLKEFGERILS